MMMMGHGSLANANNSPPFTPFHITAQYRQSLSNFLFYSDKSIQDDLHSSSLTSWIGDTARSLALRAAAPVFADGNIPNKLKNGKQKTKRVSAGEVLAKSLHSPPYWPDFICMACGTLQFPPVAPIVINKETNSNNSDRVLSSTSISVSLQRNIQEMKSSYTSDVYLRPMKRGRTRRRRASRSKAKHFQNQSLSLQRRGGVGAYNNSNSRLRKDALAKEAIRRIASSYCLGDGRAKSCLVLPCAFCRTKKKRKGVELEHKNSKIGKGGRGSEKKVAASIHGVVERQNVSRSKRHQSQESCGSTVGRHESVASQIRDNSDFISLSSSGRGTFDEEKSTKGKHHNNGQVLGRKRSQDDNSDAFISPLLVGKKKKKKKTETKRGNLMDFLSSLND